MKLKTLLIGLMTLVISFQTFAATETKTYYSPQQIQSSTPIRLSPIPISLYDDIKISKKPKPPILGWPKNCGAVKRVLKYIEFVDGKKSKEINYYKTGRYGVKQVEEFVDGKLSKVTIYYPNGGVQMVAEFVEEYIGQNNVENENIVSIRKDENGNYFAVGGVAGQYKIVTFNYINSCSDFRNNYYNVGYSYNLWDSEQRWEAYVRKNPLSLYVDGNIPKLTFYHKNGKVIMVQEYINGKKSKATIYYKTGEVRAVVEYVDSKPSKTTFYNKNGEVKSVY
jgi:hypothetical protein